MASRNTVREFTENAYYHVYNRGVEKRVIFLDEQDYTVFLGLLKKYLVGENYNKANRHKAVTIGSEVQLLAYCLMPNHFHLLLYQVSQEGVAKLMRRVTTGYVMYFNSRYARVGGLFQGRYRASRINADAYLHHISRYIHLNPEQHQTWPYSSLKYYQRTQAPPEWLHTEKIIDLFHSRREYLDFVDEYRDSMRELSLLKWQLDNNPDDPDTP